ncbi:MAG TPA: RsmG family class I SAM-dependent methyltransferase [Acidimicrobiales bacterium]|nr:RsmG family class I SAM-dependent methyltransferase [Acidimicrobiales bacterium]
MTDRTDGAVPPALREVLGQARSLDLLGPMALDEQVDHALGFAHAFEQARADDPTPGRWLDLGSGGGLPGLVLAQYWPSTPAVLLDSAERRTTFLAEASAELGWAERVQVIRARAEDAGSLDSDLRALFDVVWARSFGSPPVTAECAAPFLKPGGLLVVSEPPGPGQAVARWPRDGLAQLGQEPLTTVGGRFGYQVILQATACPQRFPRRSGVATKRPVYRVSAG